MWCSFVSGERSEESKIDSNVFIFLSEAISSFTSLTTPNYYFLYQRAAPTP